MRKLKLDPEALRVESFDTHADDLAYAGTVRGHATIAPCIVYPSPDPVVKTQAYTCPYTCDDATCVGSCQGTSCYPPACNTCESCPGGPCPATYPCETG